MRTSFLMIAAVLLAACSDGEPPEQSTAPPPPVPRAVEQADVAAAEVAEPQPSPAGDPCDLRGYDMSKMTVDRHEELVKACDQWKQSQTPAAK